jgi:hypothetical protein
MRILVCGGRDFYNRERVYKALSALHAKKPITVLIHGDAAGADRLGRDWAKIVGVEILAFPANWELYGKRAGSVRNRKMLREGLPDLVVAFPGGRGTADMVLAAREAGVRVWDLRTVHLYVGATQGGAAAAKREL